MHWILSVNNLTLLGQGMISFWEERERCEGRRWGLMGGEKCIVARPNSGCLKEAYKNSECMCSFQGCKVRYAECFCPWVNETLFCYPLKKIHLTQKFANCGEKDSMSGSDGHTVGYSPSLVCSQVNLYHHTPLKASICSQSVHTSFEKRRRLWRDLGLKICKSILLLSIIFIVNR